MLVSKGCPSNLDPPTSAPGVNAEMTSAWLFLVLGDTPPPPPPPPLNFIVGRFVSEGCPFIYLISMSPFPEDPYLLYEPLLYKLRIWASLGSLGEGRKYSFLKCC